MDARQGKGDVEPRRGDVVEVDRLLDEEHVAALAESREDLLRALPDEIPAKVAMDDEGHVDRVRGRQSKRAGHFLAM
jgi:hypothetical protein